MTSHLKILPKLLIFSLVICSISFCSNQVENKNKTEPASGQNVGIKFFELFTSEGCSSCPPADEQMLKLVKENKAGVFVLSYHVDYWNRLGWKDSFSSPEFTKRQNHYAVKFNSQSVYTPQLVVNGITEFTGSEEESIRRELAIKNPPANPSDLEVEIIKINKNNINFKYSLPATRDQQINFALVQTEATTKVKRGENSGRTLKHINIVRSLKTLDLSEESQESEVNFDVIPESGKYFVIAFAQNKKDLKITHALKLDL